MQYLIPFDRHYSVRRHIMAPVFASTAFIGQSAASCLVALCDFACIQPNSAEQTVIFFPFEKISASSF